MSDERIREPKSGKNLNNPANENKNGYRSKSVTKEKSADDETLANLLRQLLDAESIIIDDVETAFFVDGKTGEFIGPTAEGTTSIIIFAGRRDIISTDGPTSGQAIRIPRLLQLDQLLNFHLAEICYHESLQAFKVEGLIGLHGGKPLRNRKPNPYAKIPGTEVANCYIGFYLSPNSKYRLALLSETQAWPKDFEDYLIKKGSSAKAVFAEISKRTDKEAKSDGGKTLENLLYIPHVVGDSGADLSAQHEDGEDKKTVYEQNKGKQIPTKLLYSLGRLTIEDTYFTKDIGGWWFNLPICGYSWMTADLERLLTGLLDDDISRSDIHDPHLIASWEPRKWIQMFRTLALGLSGLHYKGLVHGDPRPANIMAKLPEREELLPEQFRWIDVGLGYSHGSRNQFTQEGESEIDLTPAPLGAGRVSPFYAPERIESVEFEDADRIGLSKLPDGHFKLTFYWKRRTYGDPLPLKLKDKNGRALRELGTLESGDRIHLREFIFDVARVEADHVVVSKIYELVMDRVLVKHKDQINDAIFKKLKDVAISRYRILKQWSEATDIYGLGILVLYVFFLRGLFVKRIVANYKGASPTGKGFTIEKSTRDKIFQELASLLRNQSFLNSVMRTLKERGNYRDKNDLWIPRIFESLDSDKANGNENEIPKNEGDISGIREDYNVVDHILTMDQNFRIVLLGVNNNNGMFILILYFCLCCVWRKDEIDEVLTSDFKFEPYCDSRRKIKLEKNRGKLATNARKDLERISSLIDAARIDPDEFFSLRVALEEVEFASRNDQIAMVFQEYENLRNSEKESKARINQIKEEYREERETVENHWRNEIRDLKEGFKGVMDQLEKDNKNKSEEIQQLEAILEENNKGFLKKIFKSS